MQEALRSNPDSGVLDAPMPQPSGDSTRVYFAGDSTRVDRQYHDAIRDQAQRFIAGPGGTLIVSGHANPVDEPEAAVRLSMDRTQAVAALLEQFGVQSHRIVRVSHGANAPLVDVSDEASSWLNRCVEIRPGALAPRQPVWSQRGRKPARGRS